MLAPAAPEPRQGRSGSTQGDRAERQGGRRDRRRPRDRHRGGTLRWRGAQPFAYLAISAADGGADRLPPRSRGGGSRRLTALVCNHGLVWSKRSWDKVLFIVVNAMNKTRVFAARLERMMGLEPTTFCMANASDRSRPFAPVRSNSCFAGFAYRRVNGSAPERTPNLAILATESGAEAGGGARRAALALRRGGLRDTDCRPNPDRPFSAAGATSPRAGRAGRPTAGCTGNCRRASRRR